MPYFDHNATTPLAPAAREAWLKASEEAWQNPSSPYRSAARVRLRLDAVRAHLADMLESEPARMVFTSGATEAADAILAHLGRSLPAQAKVLINPTEHPAVLEAARCHFGEQRLTWLPLSRDGVVTWSVVEQAIREAGWLGGEEPRGAVVVMAANNETGVLQPWPEIARLCQSLAIPYVCDASQWLGKLSASGFGQVAWAFGAAHKLGGPKGVGFLQRPKEEESFVIRRGGGQEGGQRAGTENLASIAAMVAALVEAEQSKVLRESERQQWRDVFERDLQLALPGVAIIGAGAERLWNTAALRMPHGENHRWVAQLDKLGFEVAIGSACATGKSSGSHVLPAMGYSVEDARRVLRVSAGWKTTPGDWQALMEALVKVAPVLKTDASVVSV